MLNEVLILLITLTAGFIGPIVGLGGGFLILPLLVLVLGFPVHEAVIISLASVSGIALSAFLTFSRKKLVNFKLGLMLEFFTVLGALVGSTLASHLDEKILEILFGITTIYVSFKMIKTSKHKVYKIFKKRKLFFAYLSSFLAGLIASMIGIGGGVLKVPIMNLILSVPIRMAIGTSEFMITITSITAVLNYHLQGIGKIYYELIGIISGFCGAQLGSRMSLKLGNVFLKKLFAFILFFFSILMITKGIV